MMRNRKESSYRWPINDYSIIPPTTSPERTYDCLVPGSKTLLHFWKKNFLTFRSANNFNCCCAMRKKGNWKWSAGESTYDDFTNFFFLANFSQLTDMASWLMKTKPEWRRGGGQRRVVMCCFIVPKLNSFLFSAGEIPPPPLHFRGGGEEGDRRRQWTYYCAMEWVGREREKSTVYSAVVFHFFCAAHWRRKGGGGESLLPHNAP